MEKFHDAFGKEIWDYHKTGKGFEIVENDNGSFCVSAGPSAYFTPFRKWPAHQKKALRYAKGRVLDAGCGAGRVAIYLQERGLDVLGIDTSPLAIKVCKERGLKKVKVMSVTQLSRGLGLFDTIVMYGNNFGLFGSFKRAQWLLKRFYKMTTANARIIAETLDVYDTKDPEHLAYHRFNRKRGRMAGQVRLRVRYKRYVTPWFDYLLVSKDEMRQIVDGTGWKIERFVDSPGPMYIGILEKDN